MRISRMLAILCLASALVPAQTPIKVGTRLVQVDVVVRDKNGPVHGLTDKDFELFDRGKLRKIALFGASTAAPGDAPSHPLAPNVVSNRIDRAGSPITNVTAILLDRLNTSSADQAWATQEVLKVLRSLQPGDRVALFTLSKTVRVLADFTADPERVRAALSRMGPEHSFDLAASDGRDENGILPDSEIPVTGDPETDLATERSVAEMRLTALEGRVEITARGMRLLARHLGGLPGRKNLIWISSSFPLTHQERDRGSATLGITPAVRALNEANVAVYPVDPRGLEPGLLLASTNGLIGVRPPRPTTLGPSGVDTMNLLARETGGRAFYNSNDMIGAVRAALDDAQATYVLGFYPDENELDDRFHSLKVKVTGSGIETHHRAGYFAGSSAPLTDPQRRSALRNVFTTPLEATGVGLSAVVQPVKSDPGKSMISISVNMSDLQPEPQGDRWVVAMELATLSSVSKPAKLRTEAITLSLSGDQLRQAIEQGYILQRPIQTNGAKGVVRIALQGRTTGAVGSVTLPIR